MLRDAVQVNSTLALVRLKLALSARHDLVYVLTLQAPVISARNAPGFSAISQLPLTMLSGSGVTMGSDMEGISLG
jgi:hypothetical protein